MGTKDDSNFLKALRARHKWAKRLAKQLKALEAGEQVYMEGVPVTRSGDRFYLGGDHDDTYSLVQAAMFLLTVVEDEMRAEEQMMGWSSSP